MLSVKKKAAPKSEDIGLERLRKPNDPFGVAPPETSDLPPIIQRAIELDAEGAPVPPPVEVTNAMKINPRPEPIPSLEEQAVNRDAELSEALGLGVEGLPDPKRKTGWRDVVGGVSGVLDAIGSGILTATGGRPDITELEESRKRFAYRTEQDKLDRAERGADRAISRAGTKATILGATEEGGEVQGFGKVPGKKRQIELQEEAKDITEQRTIERSIKQAQAKVKAMGIAPDSPQYTAILKRVLNVPDMIDAGMIDSRLKGRQVPTEEVIKAILSREKQNFSFRMEDFRQDRQDARAQMKYERLTPKQAEQFGDIEAQYDSLKFIRDELYPAAKTKIGPYAGRMRNFWAAGGGTVAREFIDLDTETMSAMNALLKIRSGSAVTDNELRRIAREMPTTSDQRAVFESKLKLAVSRLERVMDIHLRYGGQPTLARMRAELEASMKEGGKETPNPNSAVPKPRPRIPGERPVTAAQ